MDTPTPPTPSEMTPYELADAIVETVEQVGPDTPVPHGWVAGTKLCIMGQTFLYKGFYSKTLNRKKGQVYDQTAARALSMIHSTLSPTAQILSSIAQSYNDASIGIDNTEDTRSKTFGEVLAELKADERVAHYFLDPACPKRIKAEALLQTPKK